VLANVGSIVGLFATPFAGAYCSSKAAIHSLSDALRMELAPFAIRVVTIQPGGVRSNFGNNAEAALRLPADSLYKPIESAVHARAQAGQQGATSAEVFVGPVVDALLSARPQAVVRGGHNSTLLPLLKRILPTAMFDSKLSKAFGLHRLGTGR
jgi:short-subunit dehydrogenase